MSGRILAVDPGEKRLGLALSDPTGTIAAPLRVLPHVSRAVDSAVVAQIAAEQGVERIIVGQPLDEDGQASTPGARSAARFAEVLQTQTDILVELWDESMSTQDAQQIRRAMGVSRRKRAGHLDDLAAAVILQSYLDHQNHLPR